MLPHGVELADTPESDFLYFHFYREVTWCGALIADLGRVRHGSCTWSLTFRVAVKAAAPKLWKKLPRDFEKRVAVEIGDVIRR